MYILNNKYYTTEQIVEMIELINHPDECEILNFLSLASTKTEMEKAFQLILDGIEDDNLELLLEYDYHDIVNVYEDFEEKICP